MHGSPSIEPQQSARAAVAELFRVHGNDVFGVGLKMCGNRADAEDLVQETFLRAYRDWPSFQGRSSPATWLYTIAVRVCRRMHRRRVGEPPQLDPITRDTAGDDLSYRHDGPLENAARSEAREVVQRAISRLPLHYRLPLALKELTDFSVDEVAAITGLKAATVRTRVHRARLQLAKEIARTQGANLHDVPCSSLCRDLLVVKQRSLDDKTPFQLPPEKSCESCRAIFHGLDAGQKACRETARRELPDAVQRVLWDDLTAGNA
jgi:RNA polymerase sigma-70 factor (ECF subfamily)